MMEYLRLLRLNQWIKNAFVFAAAFFGGIVTSHRELIFPLFEGFFAFSFVASSVYILNDIRDVDADRLHPEKRKRPIASGIVSVNGAWYLLFAMFLAGCALGWLAGRSFLYVLLTYAVINILYSYGLKKVALLDILMVSSGFILRVFGGGLIAAVEISHWLYIMTFLLALFLAIAKRRDDLLLLENTGNEMRKAIKGYNITFVNSAMTIMVAVIIVSYILYITSPEIVARFHQKNLYVSSFFVITGLLRYLQLTMVEGKSGSPTRVLLSDLFLQVIIVLWLCFFAMAIYYPLNGF